MLRDLRELRWRRRGPPLPASVLEAAKLKIDPQGQGRWRLPRAYRSFLSQMDGGRPGRGAFRAADETHVVEGFYAFADAANIAEKLRKSGKLPEGYLPVAFTDGDRPLVFLELDEHGKVFLKASPRTKFDDPKAVVTLAKDFAGFLDMLGDPDEQASSTQPVNPWATPAPAPKKAPAAKAKAPAAKKKATKKKAPAAKKKLAKKKAAKKKLAKKKAPAAKKKATKKKSAATNKKAAKKKTTRKKAANKKAAKKKTTRKKAAKKKAARRR